MERDSASGSHVRKKRRISIDKDDKIWSSWQYHIDLEKNIFSRLPLEDSFDLSSVCKGWRSVACHRLALREPLQRPFFTLNLKRPRNHHKRLDGSLYYNFSAKTWEWTGEMDFYWPSSVMSGKGMMCLYDITRRPREYSLVMVVDWRSKGILSGKDWRSNGYMSGKGTWRKAGDVPNTGRESIIEMSVESSSWAKLKPFRLVWGSMEFDTQVWDSEKEEWETKPCRPRMRGRLTRSTGCVECKGRVYITMEHKKEILVYDFEAACWSSVVAPYAWRAANGKRKYLFGSLGTWREHLFYVVENKDLSSLMLWESIFGEGRKKPEWRQVDRMPVELYRDRFLKCTNAPHDNSMRASFCGGFVLVYSWSFKQAMGGKFCMYNMVVRTWEKLHVELPRVHYFESDPIKEDYEEEDHNEDHGEDHDKDKYYDDDELIQTALTQALQEAGVL